MSAKNSQTIKGLQVRKAKLESNIELLTEDSKKASRALSLEKNQLAEIERRIEQEIEASKEKGEIIVSEHAILRFVQRAMGVDLDWVKAEIIGDNSQLMMGNGKYPIGNNLKAIVRDNTVVSVVKS